jgi:glycosyltransferase involved in cell wall biosynthesis
MHLDFSIVIPVRNGETTLARTLESIAAQTLAPREVLVVDNGSTDQTQAIARSFKKTDCILEPRVGRSIARNRGAATAKGTYVVFLDADVTLEPKWLEKVRAYLEENPIDIMTTAIVPAAASQPRSALDSHRYEFAKFKSQGTFISLRKPRAILPVVNSAACLIRRKSFVPFDESLKRNEDADLSIRMFAAGYIVGALSDATAEVTFEPPANRIPMRRELSYLYRSFESRYWARGLSTPLSAAYPLYLKSLISNRASAKTILFSFAAEASATLGGLIGATRQNGMDSSPQTSPQTVPGARRRILLTFTHKNQVYSARSNCTFAFIDEDLYSGAPTGRLRRIKSPLAFSLKKLMRLQPLAIADRRVLANSIFFEPLAT